MGVKERMMRTPVTAGVVQPPTPVVTGGLTIPTSGDTLSMGISQSKLQALVDRFRTTHGVMEDLKVKLPSSPRKPGFEPKEITKELLTTDDTTQWSQAFAETNAWLNYLSDLLADIEAGLVEATNLEKMVDAEIRKDMLDRNRVLGKADRFTQEEIDTEVMTNTIYRDCVIEVQRLKQFKTKVEGWINIANRNLRVVSRQVSIHGQEVEAGIRQGNIGRPPLRPITR